MKKLLVVLVVLIILSLAIIPAMAAKPGPGPDAQPPCPAGARYCPPCWPGRVCSPLPTPIYR